MTLIWLSPGLPAEPSAIGAALGSTPEVSTAATPPPGASLAVLTVFERDLIERLASVPGAGPLLLLKPPGTATPTDLPGSSGPTTVVEATDVADVTAATCRPRRPSGAAAAPPSSSGTAGARLP